MIGYLQHYAKQLLKRVAYKGNVRVQFADQDTASTNGVTIKMPRNYLGLDFDTMHPTKKALKVACGLIMHECGHFLQPLKEISAAERETGLNHFFVNIFLDVQLERVAQKIWADEIANLYELRKFTRAKMYKSYVETFKATQENTPDDFPTLAAYTNLIGRFHKKDRPYFTKVSYNRRKHTYTYSRKLGSVKLEGNLGYFQVDTYKTPIDHNELTDRVRYIAGKYPELCQPALELPESPMMVSSESSSDEETEKALSDAGKVAHDLIEVVFADMKRGKPYPEAIKLAMQLRLKLKRDDVAMKIVAPVDIDRRKLATGDYQPWTMATVKGKAKKRHCSLLIDCSGSMDYTKRADKEYSNQKLAFIAAQAICIAVESEEGSVTGGQFGTNGMLSKDLDASPLFSPISVSRERENFKLLTPVWINRPEANVIVITDADAADTVVPEYVTSENKARTYIITLSEPITPALYELGTIIPCHDMSELPKLLLDIVN